MLDSTCRVDDETSLLEAATGVFDPLLACLLQLAKIEHRPCSPASATAGLPLVHERLTPELFVRAADRTGLKAKILRRELSAISPLVCPAVLLLHDDNAVVLVKIEAEAGQALLLDNETGGEQRITLDELQHYYSGYCIFAKPAYRFDLRTQPVKSQRNRHWFWSVMVRSWRIYRDVLLASLLINIFAMANPLFVMNVYDRVVPNSAIETLWVLAIGVTIVYGFDLLLKTLRAYFLEVAGKKSDVLLSSYIFERVLGARLSERAESVGAFASQLREFETVRNFITSSTVTTFVDLPFVVLFLVVVAYIGGPIVVAPLVAIPLIVGFALYLQRPLRYAVEQTYQAGAQKNGALVETLSNIETVKILGAEGRIQAVWEASVGHLARWGQRTRLLSSSASTVSATIIQITSVAVVIIGVYLIAERELTMGALIASVMLTSRALSPMGQVASLLVNYHQTVTAYQGLEQVVAKEQEREEGKPLVQRPRLDGGIRFDKVCFSYPNEETRALSEVSFDIRPGERVGIIGRIGSGKSTVQKLMLGLYHAQQGTVLVDSINIKQIDSADLRRNIGCVPQDTVLFYGSVKDNIVYGSPHVEDKDILRAADLAGVTEFVNNHPSGFGRPVGERGRALSGGQRQSVAVARALLNDPSIYLLDEPSTGMDSSSEVHLKEKLTEVTKGKTLVLVTHKTALLSLVDRVLVFDGGRLIADGPKEPVLDALRKGQLRVAQP
ncbi:type I secretion system permease/ATPase [Aestuariicella hydrocarbonica]|uniref:Type I secretion system permease/ATPase n=2 Tax=Pseudomaricurvus hydrocarbonicus TaxID=1470433 RepID=A0A9E5MQ87_9GAMM|nr:type I secretion system permease/ATPase [Aestuariicella hydrocarbonica]